MVGVFMTIRVGLFGTCNDSTWRERLIPLLNCDYFNPVVKEWNDEAKENEFRERKTCDYVVYCITPKLKGFYSFAELVEDSIIRSRKTIFVYLENDDEFSFDKQQINSLKATEILVSKYGVISFDSLEDLATFLNVKNK
jgi:hypothetical protein